MRIRSKVAAAALPMAGLLLLAACGSDSNNSSSNDTSAAATTAAASETTTAASTGDTGGGSGAAVSLKGICPDTITILTDWNPEGEHGFLYQLLAPNPTIDTKEVSVTGTLVDQNGNDTGVKLKVRSGGPAVGFQTVTSQLYSDDNILLGFVYTDEAIQNSAKFPTVAIESGFNKNPQMIMWDPATYPDVKTIADLGKTKAIVRYFKGAAYMDFLTSTGVLNKNQVDGSYDGTPAAFIADQGKAAQQGFGSAEPYIYKNEVKDWGKDVAYSYINDAGWDNYAESIATKPDNITKYADCFKQLVPLIQHSSVDYLKDPAKANKIILDAVAKFNNGWVYSQGVADYAVDTIKKDGLVANGPDGVMGKFDLTRVNDLITKAIPVYTAGGSAPKSGLKAEDIVTNQFIDPSVGM
jgi:hypothetical protein